MNDLDNIPRSASVLPSPVEGVRMWQNEKNRFLVFELHYSANPEKRKPVYSKTIKDSMPIRKFMQEYELNWDSFTGLPVYADFKKQLHISEASLEPEIGLPLLRGWDQGLYPACIIAQYVKGQLRILKEIIGHNEHAITFVPRVKTQLNLMYPQWADQKKDWLDWTDPAAFSRKDTDPKTFASIMVQNGLRPKPGPVPFMKRKGAVDEFLVRHTREGPGIILDPYECPTLLRGFDGGYRYPDTYDEIEPGVLKPLKDEYSHPHDALQYLCWGVSHKIDRKKTDVPTPQYAFAKHAKRKQETRPTTADGLSLEIIRPDKGSN